MDCLFSLLFIVFYVVFYIIVTEGIIKYLRETNKLIFEIMIFLFNKNKKSFLLLKKA